MSRLVTSQLLELLFLDCVFSLQIFELVQEDVVPFILDLYVLLVPFGLPLQIPNFIATRIIKLSHQPVDLTILIFFQELVLHFDFLVVNINVEVPVLLKSDQILWLSFLVEQPSNLLVLYHKLPFQRWDFLIKLADLVPLLLILLFQRLNSLEMAGLCFFQCL